MNVQKMALPAANVLFALYLLYSQKVSTVSLTFGAALVVYGLTKSLVYMLCVLAVPVAIQLLNSMMMADPVPRTEGFQVKDPVSIQKRLIDSKQGAPLAPKQDSPTGVLESPDILDNVPLQATGDAGTASSLPSSTFSSAMIQPPPESSVQIPGSVEHPIMANPVLQNGPDNVAVGAALITVGTASPAVPMVPGMTNTAGA